MNKLILTTTDPEAVNQGYNTAYSERATIYLTTLQNPTAVVSDVKGFLPHGTYSIRL